MISRYINADLRPKHDSNTQFDVGQPWTAAYDPVAEEHVLTTGSGYWSTASVRRFSPMGATAGGPWRLATGSMAPSVALDPSTGAGIVAYITEPEFDEGTTVWAQRLAPGGGPQGSPVRLSQLATGVKVDLHRPAVAFNPARGEFAVAWRERRTGIGAYVGDIVMTGCAASGGGAIGVPAAISDSRLAIVAQNPREIPDGAGAPGLAYDAATGGYLATWLAARGDVLESPTQVYGQRLDGELREVGPDDFRISTGPGTVDFNAFPTVALNDGMVVVWKRWIGDVPQVVGRRVIDSSPRSPPSVGQRRIRPLRVTGAGRTGDRPAAARHGRRHRQHVARCATRAPGGRRRRSRHRADRRRTAGHHGEPHRDLHVRGRTEPRVPARRRRMARLPAHARAL